MLAQELIVQCGTIYRGYISEIFVNDSQNRAHILFFLPEEAVAASVTLSTTSLLFGTNKGVIKALGLEGFLSLHSSDVPQQLPLTLRIGISDGKVDTHHPSATNSRMVRKHTYKP